jgi:hypothetical protein
MDQKIVVVLQRLDVDRILLAGVAARRGTAQLCCRRREIGAVERTQDSSSGSHFVLDSSRDDVLEYENYEMGWCA